MINNYENIVEEFNNKKCSLLTKKDEYQKLLNNSIKCNYKLDYIASCGHKNSVFYNVFKYRNTGIICQKCKNKKNMDIIKYNMENNNLSKIYNIELEYKCILKIKELTNKYFDINKAFDGCNVDLIYKPINICLDLWVGIQVKTTLKKNLTYSFHINKKYENCLIFLYCYEDNKMWIIPENIIGNQKKISIGYTKSKYNIYEVCNNNIIEKLNNLYTITTKNSFNIINKPINIYQVREQEFRKFREIKINFIKFIYDEIEGTVYDFKINNFKIQEKITIKNNKNIYNFTLYKNNGKKNKKKYDINDNDFYWLNCDNKKFFFVIPEKILIEKKIIGTNDNNYFLNIKIDKNFKNKYSWLYPYMFNYETINNINNKKRLLTLFF